MESDIIEDEQYRNLFVELSEYERMGVRMKMNGHPAYIHLITKEPTNKFRRFMILKNNGNGATFFSIRGIINNISR